MAAVERGSTGGGFGAAKSSDSLIFGSVGSEGSTVAGATATGSSSAGAVPTSTVGSAGGGDTGATGSTGSTAGAGGTVWATGSGAGVGAGAAAGVLVSAAGSVGGAVAGVSPEPHPTSRAAHAHEIGKNLMRRKSTRRPFKSRLYLQKETLPRQNVRAVSRATCRWSSCDSHWQTHRRVDRWSRHQSRHHRRPSTPSLPANPQLIATNRIVSSLY